MKLTIVLSFICLQLSALGNAQTVTLSLNNESIKTLFMKINQQTGYEFMYNSQMIEQAKPVTVDLKDTPLEEALKECFKNQPLSYTISEKTIIVVAKTSVIQKETEIRVSPKSIVTEVAVTDTIIGKVTTLDGNPLPEVNILIKGSKQGTFTDANGRYKISCSPDDKILVFSHLVSCQQSYDG